MKQEHTYKLFDERFNLNRVDNPRVMKKIKLDLEGTGFRFHPDMNLVRYYQVFSGSRAIRVNLYFYETGDFVMDFMHRDDKHKIVYTQMGRENEVDIIVPTLMAFWHGEHWASN